MTTFPYQADVKVWIMQPRVVFKARVNLPAATYPLAEAPYDGVTFGAYTDIEQNMTVLIGSTEGAWDLGRTYARGDNVWNVATSTVLNIGYSSRGRGLGSVDLQDNAYLTVLDLHEVWQRPSKDGKLDGSILYDYSIGVPGNYKPVLQVVNGRNEGGVGMMEAVDPDTGVLEVDLDANGSYFMDPAGGESWWDIQTSWDVKDGTITSGAPDDFAITAEFPPGYRYVRWRTATTDAKFGLPRMYLVVALDEDTPADASLLTAHDLSWEETPEGQTLTVSVKERLDPADYIPGTVVMLLVDDHTGPRLAFGGWLDYDQSFSRSTTEDVERGTTLYCLDVAHRLDQLKASPGAFARDEDEPYAATLKDAQPFRIAYRYLFFQTSAPQVANIDLNLAYGDDFPFTQYGVAGGSQYGINDVLGRAVLCRFVCDETGWLKFILDPIRQELVDRTSTVQATLTEDDWSGLQRSKKRESFGALRGVAQLTSTIDAEDVTVPLSDLYGIAPGPIAAQGKSEGSQGYTSLVRSETEHWRRLGQDLARANPREDLMTVDIAPGVPAIHPSRLTWVLMNVSEDVVDWNGSPLVDKRCLPSKISYAYDAAAGSISKSVTLELETDGPPGTRDPRPVVTTTRIIREPTLSPIAPPSSFGLMTGTPTIAAFNTDGGVYLFSNFDASTPTAVRVALDTSIPMFIVDAFSPLYLGTGGTVDGMLLTGSGPKWMSDIFNSQTLGTLFSIGDLFGVSMQSERVVEGLFVIVNHPNDGRVNLYVSEDRGDNWTTLSSIGGIWVGGAGDGFSPGLYVSAHVANKMLFSAFVGSGATTDGSLYQSLDNGASAAALNPGNTFKVFAMDIQVGFSDTAETNILHGGPVAEGGNLGHRLYRTSGATMTEISPRDSGSDPYGPTSQFNIAISPQNADVIYLVGTNADVSPKSGLWRSVDGGDNWTQMQPESATFPWQRVLVAGDNPDVIYLLGSGIGGLWLGYSTDGGATIQDKSGNIPVAYSGAGAFVNLAGG